MQAPEEEIEMPPRPADMVYVTDTGFRLCTSCADKAKKGALVFEEQIRMSVLDGELDVIQEHRDDAGQLHKIVDQYPAEDPTPCDACFDFLSPSFP